MNCTIHICTEDELIVELMNEEYIFKNYVKHTSIKPNLHLRPLHHLY